ncbi:MAG: sensor domain-containing protein [Planctomycetota bacterium]
MEGVDPRSSDAVGEYLARLELALRGADPALAHDALVDAEQHLRDAMRSGQTAEAAIAAYGSPAEIAAAYGHAVDAAVPASGAAFAPAHAASPATAPVAAAPTRGSRLRAIPVVGVWFEPRAWGALLYFGIVGFALSLAYFIWAVALGSLAIGTLPLVLGLPLIVFLLGSARAICLFDGMVVGTLLGVRMPRRTQIVAGADEVGFWQRVWCWLRDVRSWMSLGYLYGSFPVLLVLFVLTIALAAVSASLMMAPIVQALDLPFAYFHRGDSDMEIQFLWRRLDFDAEGNAIITWPFSLAMGAFGFALGTALLWMMRGLGWVYGRVVQAIQVARPHPARAAVETRPQ